MVFLFYSTFLAICVILFIRLSFNMQVDSVSGDLVMNNGTPPWWSFHDLNPLDLTGCQGLSGPLAIVVSEETPRM